ncbi:hypothetical protein [Mesorhizobium sp. B2-3-10]|uniref:hypothetical protein n=1 Tax=Mesorhizobium sp. B2-3-10 TaxID=2589954 RepID=UPI00112AD0DE|nr:hypothetical protein [Mesorhizobium sp. B2-3-10]TPM04537.1 hypothetical protein FJ943_04020 [Mesorhizobium sp. B2-3-10]
MLKRLSNRLLIRLALATLAGVLVELSSTWPSKADLLISCADNGEGAKEVGRFASDYQCMTCVNESAIKKFMLSAVYGADTCPPPAFLDVHIIGSINFADAYFFSKNAEFTQKSGRSFFRRLFLNSDGGQVDAALQIGAVVNSVTDTAIVKGHCYSACVLILMAANRRVYIDEDVGIHRMSVDELPSDLVINQENVSGYFAKKYEEIAGYAERNGVDKSIVDSMKAAPSTQIRKLTYRQLKELGLGYINTTYAEITRYRIARRYGRDGVIKYAELLSKFEACVEDLGGACSGKALARYDEEIRELEKAAFGPQ